MTTVAHRQENHAAKRCWDVGAPSEGSRNDMKDAEQKIREVNATMSMEGMPLTDEDKARLRDILEGRTTAEETVRGLVKKHARKREPDYERV
jgi:hypothetical protein